MVELRARARGQGGWVKSRSSSMRSGFAANDKDYRRNPVQSEGADPTKILWVVGCYLSAMQALLPDVDLPFP